jgi:hypothetical protein
VDVTNGEGIAVVQGALGAGIFYRDTCDLAGMGHNDIPVGRARQGALDIGVPTANSCTILQHLPNARPIIYPDANHGSFYQYPEPFAEHANCVCPHRSMK